MEENNIQKSGQIKEKQSVKYRLKKNVAYVTNLTSIAALVAIIALLIVGKQYSNALTSYGFIQGDIGKAMTVLAGSQSSVRAIIGYLDESAIKDQKNRYKQKREKFDKYFKNIEVNLHSSKEKSLYSSVSSLADEYFTLADKIVEEGATTDSKLSQDAQTHEINKLSPKYNEIYSNMRSIMDYEVTLGNSTKEMLSILEIATVVVVIIVMVVARIQSTRRSEKFAEGMQVILRSTSERLTKLTEGDFDSPFPKSDYDDEFNQMINDSEGMSEDLKKIIKDIENILGSMSRGNFMVQSGCRELYQGTFNDILVAMRDLRDQMIDTLQNVDDASVQVSAGSDNLAQSAQALAEGATDQAGAVEELTSTIANITASAEQSAQNLIESHQQAKEYARQADEGRQQMKDLAVAMKRITDTSKQIENITAQIEDIASQTNLLSLNASIEAARAGEAGKGFAVVADEIRTLAEQSAASAVSTRELIEGALKEIDEGNTASKNAEETLKIVIDGIESIAETSKQLSEDSKMQVEAMEQAELGVNQISEVVQSNSAAAEETSATSEELSAQADTLKGLIGKFILK